MAFELLQVFVRSSTRLRFFFSDTVTGAPLGAWVLSSLDGNPSPVQVQSLIVQGNQVELVLSDPIVGGGFYRATLRALQISSGFVTAPATSLDFIAPNAAQPASNQLSIKAFQSNIFGEDIAWNGSDWVEGHDGDLATVTGPENARAAILRRQLSDGLIWDDSYGLKPSEFVDAPDGELPELVLRAEAQSLADDRVKSARARSLGTSVENPEQQLIGIDVEFIDGTTASVTVPVTSG